MRERRGRRKRKGKERGEERKGRKNIYCFKFSTLAKRKLFDIRNTKLSKCKKGKEKKET